MFRVQVVLVTAIMLEIARRTTPIGVGKIETSVDCVAGVGGDGRRCGDDAEGIVSSAARESSVLVLFKLKHRI